MDSCENYLEALSILRLKTPDPLNLAKILFIKI